jgi:hypothetical protein
MFEPIEHASTSRAYAVVCWLLSVLGAAPVLGQAVQRLSPLPYLPPLEAFEEIYLPYWLSLSVQIAVLAAMAAVSWRMHRGGLVPNPRRGRVLAWLGAACIAVAFGRIVFGLAVPDATSWLCVWLPMLFHIGLAGFVLTISAYHRRELPLMW